MLSTIDHGPIREIRLSRPPANALSPELIAALGEAVAGAPKEGFRALVLSGSPGWFSGGLDVPHLLPLDRAAIRQTWESLYRLMFGLAASPIPVAAAITGHSPAGGAVLGIFCDFRVMAEGDFKIGLNEVAVGIPLPVAIFRAFVRLVGPHQAERLSVTAGMIPPAEALRIGFVDEVAPPEEVVPRAVAWCQGLLALPPIAMAETRQRARADLVRIIEEGLAGELDPLVEMWFSDETQGVLRALVERLAAKRKG
ncbi:MAG TPA: enoyl-CoA hydratase/isomerase family protein [Thermoanaerobaculia bacterium]|nr:enoyl-CoA hydratase/isomerase family protein [Thermoanaerobaculia bacterium]